MLAGRAGEIGSRRETPSQCGRVGSPVLAYFEKKERKKERKKRRKKERKKRRKKKLN